jgi:hypothetical protein
MEGGGMPAVIDSAPDCVVHQAGTETARADDSLDFILQADYQDCAGIMTFGPGTAYGDTGADTAYYILTYIGIAFTIAALIAWVVFEHRHLIAYTVHRIPRRR